MSHTLPPQTLPWLDWANLRCRLDWIYEGPINPIYQETDEYVAGQTAFLVRQGGVEIRCREGSVSAGVGEWLFMNEGVRWQRFSGDARVLSIRFQWAWPGGQPLFCWELPPLLCSQEWPELEKTAMRLERRVRKGNADVSVMLCDTSCDLESSVEVQIAFMQFLRLYARVLLASGVSPSRFEVADSRIMRAVWILDHHPLHEPLTEAQLSSQVNLSSGHFARLFGEQFGISPFRYLERRRLSEAVARVRASDASLKAIAIDLGFKSLSHFSSWFHRKTKRAPSDFRQR